MATLESFIKIGDGFSQPLDNLYSKMDKVANGFSHLKNSMNFNGTPKPPTGEYNQFNETIGKTGSLFKQMTGASLAASGISKVIGGITGEVKSFVSELNESSTAWQTFNGNMAMLGMNKNQIAGVRADLQKFAQDTIYSSSDMASTYSQLAAVGVKDADKLVKGFGGLASAATDPVQAMKTLSQQGTQMAAKPTVQWQDFKLMMEQTPAGIAAVARTMHKSANQLLQDVQAGSIKTQDFFNAVAKTGTNAQFSKMATTYKTVGQAMDGLRETAANTLQPAFDKLSKVGINSISKIIDKLGDVNLDKAANRIAPVFQKLMDNLGAGFDFATKAAGSFFNGLSNTDAFNALNKEAAAARDAFNTVINGIFGNGQDKFNGFKNLGELAGGAISGMAKAFTAVYNAISNLQPGDIKLLAAAFIVLKASLKGIVITGLVLLFEWINKMQPGTVRTLATALLYFAGAVAAVAAVAKTFKGIDMVKNMFGNFKTPKAPSMPKAPEPPKAPAGGAAEWLKFGAALILVGVAVIAIGAGFYIMAQAAIALGNAGGAAIAVFFGMIAAVAALAIVVAIGGSAMLAGAIGFLAFGAAVLLVGAGLWLLFAGLALVFSQLRNVATYGMQASINLMALSAAITLFGLGAAVAGALLLVFAVGLVAVGAAMLVAAVGAVALGAGAVILAAGLFLVGTALMLVGAGLAAVAAGAWALYSTMVTIFTGITSGISNAMAAVPGIISGTISGAVGIAKGFGGALVGAGSAIIDGFVNGLKSAWETGKKFVKGIADWIKEHKGPISYDRRLLTPHGQAIMAGFGAGITNGFKSVQSDISSMTGDIASGINLQPGDLMADSFGRAKAALYGLVDGMKELDANGNINVDGAMNTVPTASTLNGQVGYTGASQNDYSKTNSQHINISDGAIQINGTGNAEYDGEQITNALEKYLKGQNEGSL